MRFTALAALVLLGLAQAQAQLELREQGSSEQVDGVKRFVLTQKDEAGNDQVVGHVIHISSGGAQTSLGRKIGQGFAMPGPVLAGGVGGPLAAVLDQLDAPVGQLFAQMHQARAAMMRAMADDFALLNQRLPAPLFGALPAPAGDELPPFQPRPAPGHIMGWGRRQGLLGEEGAEGRAPCRHGHSHHPMMVMGRLWGGEPRGGDALPPFNPDWAALEEPPMVESPRWTFVAADGSTNWGFVLFLVLSAACAGVWAAGIAAYCSYVRAMRAAEGCCPARRRAQFVTSKGSAGLLSPLLPEGPLESPKLYTGVEFATDYVAPTMKEGYEPVAKA